MKRVRIIIKEKSINKRVGSEFLLFVYDEATILYAIDKIDWIIKRKAEKFPQRYRLKKVQHNRRYNQASHHQSSFDS